jgi:hypothetical protein
LKTGDLAEDWTMKQTKCQIFTAADKIKRDNPPTLTAQELLQILGGQKQETTQKRDTEVLSSDQPLPISMQANP